MPLYALVDLCKRGALLCKESKQRKHHKQAHDHH